jgi:hypothetical protein
MSLVNRILSIIISSIYLVFSLALPWFNSGFCICLESRFGWLLAKLSIVFGYFILFVMMLLVNRIILNEISFKKEIEKEFLSFHALFKSAIIYIISINFLASNDKSFGLALLIPYYMYVINFYTSIASGKIKQGWF